MHTYPIKENEESESDTIMFGKFLSDIEILSVKDSQGQHVFENTEEVRTPAFMLFAVKEEQHLLLRKAASIGNLSSEYKIDIIPVPNTTGFDGNTEEGVVTKVSNEYLKDFIEEKSIYIPEDQIVENDDPSDDVEKEEKEEKEETESSSSSLKDKFGLGNKSDKIEGDE